MKEPTRREELTDHNVQKLGTEEGDITQIGTLRLTWKARGEKTGFQFGVYESELPPGAVIPLHKHPFAEFFYVLDGTISFGRVNREGASEWLTCQAGESVLFRAASVEQGAHLTGLDGRWLRHVARIRQKLWLTSLVAVNSTRSKLFVSSCLLSPE